MTRRLEELVRQATVPLTDAAGQLLGTAFFVAPGLAITAAHVVHRAVQGRVFAPDRQGVERSLTVRVQHPPTVAPGVEPYPLPDLAILDAAPGYFEDTPCVLMGRPGPTKELLAFGYSKSIDPRHAFAPDLARLECEGILQVQGVDIIKVNQATVDPGMSGGPVLDIAAGAIVGYVKATRGAGKPYGAYVVAMSELQRYEHPTWGLSELHHRANSMWQAAKAGDFEGPDPVAATRAVAQAVIQEAESRHDVLPEGVNVAALHQTIWLRRRLPDSGKRDMSMTDLSFRQRWRSQRPLSGLTVVSGDPGFGKSWLIAYQASQVARQALHHLDEGGSVDDCIIPARLTCATLGDDREGGSDVSSLAQTLLTASLSSGLTGQNDERGYLAAVERALVDGRMLICLDGLDEMPTGHRPRLKKNLLTLLSLNNAVLMSSRPAALPIIEEIAVGNREDFELVGFTPRETVNFVRAWLRERPQSADSLLSSFADRVELAQLAQVPLLLSFLCRLADPLQHRDYRKSTLPQLYHDVARHLLSGRWHSNRAPAESEAMPDPVLRMQLLAEVIGQLQDSWRGGTEDIVKADLRAAIRRHPHYDAVAATAAVRMSANSTANGAQADAVEPVLWEFLYDGILVEAADAPLRPTVRFIHPILREMLLATYVVHLSPEGQLACIDRHRWLDASWTRVIVAAAALVPEPAPLVAHIVSGGSDPWVTQRTLAAQVIAAAPGYGDDNTAQAVLDAILAGTESPLVFERRRAVSALGTLLRSRSRRLRAWAYKRIDEAADAHDERQQGRGDVASDIKYEIIASLLEARDEAAVRVARALVVVPDCPPNVRFRLIAGLIALNTREATDMVLGMLERKSAAREDLAAFLSALRPHAHLAVAAAIRLLRNRQLLVNARVQVGRALLECGPAGVDGVREVADDRTMTWSIRCRLYAEMLRAAVPDVTAHALHLLANPHPQYRDRAELTLALIEDGATEAIPEAALLLSNPSVHWTVREALARALARQGRAGRDLLVAQLHHGAIDLDLKVRHICALVEVRDPHGSNAALHLHSDRGVHKWIRMRMAEVLLRYNAGLADEEALIELASASEHPAQSRVDLITDMIRHGFPSAENLMMNLLRDDQDESFLSWPDVFMRLSESGSAGHRCLEAVARAPELDWALRCEALLSLGKTLGGAALPASTEEVANEMPAMWRNRLVLGLARAGVAPDLDEFDALARRQHGGYPIIFEFLRRAPVDRGVVERLLTTAQGLQDRGTIEDDSPELPGIVIDRDLLNELGLTVRSEAEARQQAQWFYDTMEMRVGKRLAQLMLDEQRDEFETYVEADDEVAALDFLETSFPEYRQVVRDIFADLKAEVRDGKLRPPEPVDHSVLDGISKVASVLSEWITYAETRRWTTWRVFTAKNSKIISSDLARGILRLSTVLDPLWGPHEAALWVAERVASGDLDNNMLHDSSALLDWLKGRFDNDDFAALYLGGAYAVLRYPEHEFSGWYAAVGAQQNDYHGLALRLVRQAGETRPPGEREDGVTILEHFQSKLGWSEQITSAFRTAYLEGLRGSLADHERAVEREPDSAQYQFNLGIALQQSGRHNDAVDAYRRAVALEPHVAIRHRALAGALDAAGRSAEALEAITFTLAMDRSDPVAHAIHGAILDRLGREEESLVALRQAHELAPSNPLYLTNLGRVLRRLGRLDEAVDAYRQAVERNRHDASRRRMLAEALHSARRSEEALYEISKAVELDPADHEAHGMHGYILSNLSRHEDAVAAYTEALRIAPENPVHLTNLGLKLAALRRHDEAIALGREAVERRPDASVGYQVLTEALRTAGHFEEAATTIATAIELDPDDYRSHCMAALVFNNMGRYVEALEALTRAESINPTSNFVKANRGEALLLCGHTEEAARKLRESIRLGAPSPLESDVLLALAILAVDPDDSLTLARQALTHDVESGITPFRRAEFRAIAFLIAGDLDNAIAELRAAAPRLQPADVLQAPLYDELRKIAPEAVEALLDSWPNTATPDIVRPPAPRCGDLTDRPEPTEVSDGE